MRDLAGGLAYLGAIVALVVLWHGTGRRPFTSQRWFIILPVAIGGAAAGGFIPTYRAHAAFAALMEEPLDIPILLGEALGLGVANGALIGFVAVIGNLVRRRVDSKTDNMPH